MNRFIIAVLLIMLTGMGIFSTVKGQDASNHLNRISITPSQHQSGYVVRYHTTQPVDSFLVRQAEPRRIVVKILDSGLDISNVKPAVPKGFIESVRTFSGNGHYLTYIYLDEQNSISATGYADRNSNHLLVALMKKDSSSSSAQSAESPDDTRPDTISTYTDNTNQSDSAIVRPSTDNQTRDDSTYQTTNFRNSSNANDTVKPDTTKTLPVKTSPVINRLKRISFTPTQQQNGYVVRYHLTQAVDTFKLRRPAPHHIVFEMKDPDLETANVQLPSTKDAIRRIRTIAKPPRFITHLYLDPNKTLHPIAYPDRASNHLLLALLQKLPDIKDPSKRKSPFVTVKSADTAKKEPPSPTPYREPGTVSEKRPLSNVKSDTVTSSFPNLAAYDTLAKASWEKSSLDIQKLQDSLSKLNRQVSDVAYTHLKNKKLIGPSSSVSELSRMFDFRMSDTTTSPQLAILQAQKRVNQKDWGLAFEADYRGTSRNGFFNRARVQFGLEWDILKNGYLDSRYEAEQLDTEIQLEKFQHQNEQFDKFYGRLFNRFIYYFNNYKHKLAENYLNLLSREQKITKELYTLDYISKGEVLEINSKRKQIKNRLQNFSEYKNQFRNNALHQIEVNKLPVSDLQFEKLLKAAQSSNRKKKRFSDIDVSSYEDYHALSDISLSLFLDYNLNSSVAITLTGGQNGFSSNLIGQQNFLSYGMRLSVPLPMGRNAKKELSRARQTKLKEDIFGEKSTISKELSNHYYEYKYRLEDYIEFHRKYLQLTAKIRKELTKKKLEDPTYRPRKVLSLLDSRYDVALETIDIKQQLYLKLLKIYRFVYPRPLTDFLKLQSTNEDVRSKQTEQSKQAVDSTQTIHSIYIWSTTFKRKSNSFLLQYLKKHNIKTVYLSPGPDNSLLDKMRTFISSANKDGIRVALMIGSNRLVFPNQRDDLKQTVNQAYRMGANEVHLDVEPHTFNDWDEKRGTYEKYYLGMLEKASKLVDEKNLTLSVSIPTYYDEIFKKINDHVDGINIMAYGTKDPDQLADRISEEWNTNPQKISVALNISEFSTMKQFRNFLDEIRQVKKFKRITVHDLESLLRMENIYSNSN